VGTPSQPSAGSRARPLSPHLQIYRWPLTMLTSILHRVTGVATATGTILLTLWLAAAAAGPDTFALAHELLASIFGRLILFGYTFALCYHMLNGIRHLAWDTGAGLGVRTARLTGILVLVGTVALTLLIWAAAYALGGRLIP
jgi:succinate dehydrogenase / fumarate reductase cytochrome b subunit